MRKFIFWTGVYNIIVGLGFLFPGFVNLLGVKLPMSNFWLWFPAVTVIYLGIILILCSRNLTARASLVYWEGILRIAGFLLLAGFGFWGGFGIIIGALGIVDLLIGLVYLIGLPKALNNTAANVLLDRVA